MRLVQAYRLPVTGSPDMRPVLVERYEGPDGRDVPHFVREWSTEGVLRGFVVDVPSTRPGQDRPLRTRFSVYTRTLMNGDNRSNPGIQQLSHQDAFDIYVEFIVFRRDDNGVRLLNMRRVDVRVAESAVLAYVIHCTVASTVL